MAVYRVQAPDGSILRIEGPDNAKPEEVEAFAAAQYKPKVAERVVPDDPGFGQAALIGAGRTLDRLGKGVKQAGLNVAAAVGSDSAQKALGEMAAQEIENTRLYEPLAKQRPGATFVGEAAPFVAAPVLGGGLAGMAASAALPGLIEYGTGEERLARGAMGAAGGAVGGAIGKAVGKVIKPTESVTQAQTKAMGAAERLGVPLTAGEASGNRALRWAESASADMPIASGIASKRFAEVDKALARGATRAMGKQADEVSEAVLAEARERIGGEFQRILNPLKVNLDKSFQAEVKAITGSKVMKELRDEETEKLIGQFRNLPGKNVKVSGEWFQQNLTALDAAVSSAYAKGEPGKAKALEAFEDALHRAARRSMGKDAPAYEAARQQWGALRALESGKVVEGGRVMPGRLDSYLTNRFKGGGAYKEGKIKGELADIAALAGTLRQPPQSGTTPRAIYSGLVGGAAFAEPLTAASMVAAPSVLQGITASPAMRSYMTKGMANLSPEDYRRLMLGGTRLGLLGAYGANQ